MIHNGNNIPNFSTAEFSEDVHLYAAEALIIRAQDQRDRLGTPMYPSPRAGALARFGPKSKTSMHFASGRLSTALDWFSGAPPFETWCKVISSGLWHGMGIYFDTEYKGMNWVMFHTDYMRMGSPAYWFRYGTKKEPVYVDSINDAQFWDKLDYFFYLNYKKKDFEGWVL